MFSFNFFIFIFFNFFLATLIFFVSFFGIKKKQYFLEKISAYECGFNPFADARNKFDIKFYLVSLLFLIFDLEIIFLFPFTVICFLIFPF